MVVLVGVSIASLDLVLPISIAIAVVLAIVVVSYTQTVQAYETSGGAYVVAKDNLGHPAEPHCGCGAPHRLRPDGCGVGDLGRACGHVGGTVAAPLPGPMSLAFVALLMMANLAGIRESGVLFAIPTYGFVALMFVMIGWVS